MGFSPEDQGHSGGSSSGSSRKGAEVELETPSWGARGEGRGRPGTDQLSSLSQREAGGRQRVGPESSRQVESSKRQELRSPKGDGAWPSHGPAKVPSGLLLGHLSPTRLRAFCGHRALE